MRHSIFCCSLAINLVLLGQSPNEVTHSSGLINQAVFQAKQEGKTTASVPIYTREYPAVNSLKAALILATPSTVHVISKKTVLSGSGDNLLTLYTVRVIDSIGRVQLGDRTTEPSPTALPRGSFENVTEDSFHVLTHGGNKVIDGVSVHVPEAPALLTVGNDYVLFVRFEQTRKGRPTRLATLPIGDAGIFEYNAATDKINPVGGRDNRRFTSLVLEKVGQFYSSFKNAVLNTKTQSGEIAR